MTIESRRNLIFGEPFYAVETHLVDYKANTKGCSVIVRLERD